MAKELLQTRVEADDIVGFDERCLALGKDKNDMLRELVKAFAEGRVKITPDETQLLQRREIYHDES